MDAAQFTQLLAEVTRGQEATARAVGEAVRAAVAGEPTAPAAAAQQAQVDANFIDTTEHGDHLPSRPVTVDFIKNERNIIEYLSKERLTPYHRDLTQQLDELSDLMVTPLLDEPSKWMSYDAYCRQSNALEERHVREIDEYRQVHPNWILAYLRLRLSRRTSRTAS